MTLKMLSKKSLSIILSMAVFVVSLLIPGLAVDETPLEETIQIWDGSIATSYAGGNGSMDSPFIIETGSQLAYMLNSFGGGKYYKLAKDIYLNDVSSDTWYEADNNHTWFIGVKTSSDARYYTFDGKTSNYFNGHLDGDGHSVYGIYYPSDTTSTASGFIPVMTAGSVKNIAIRNSRIVATKNACALSAFAIPTGNITVDRFLSDSDVYLLGAANGATSGIFGYVTGNSKFLTAISNSCSLIPASNCSGGQFFKVTGIVGETWNTYYTITNCYSVMQAIHSNGEATRVSKAANAYVNVYCASAAANDINNKRMTVVTADKMVGAAAGANMWNLGSAFTVTDSYPTLKVLANIPEELWGGFASQPADSDSNGEYEIFTPEEFFWYAKNGGKAKLFNDLWLNDMKVTVTDGNPVLTKASNDDAIDLENNNLIEWYGTDTVYGAIGRVLYTLNGNGHVVNGLYHNHYGTKGGTNYAGLFNAPATNTSIYGLGIENAYMASNSSFSASFILGSTHGIYFTIDSCYAGLNTYHKGYDVGAFTGGGAKHATPSVIKNSYVLTTVSGAHGNDYSNAFAGDNWEAAAITYYDSYCKGKAYRSGTNGGNLYTNVDLAAIAGAGAQSVMPKLSGAFIINKDSHPTLKIFGETDEKI